LEPEVAEFLKRILTTIGIGFTWLAINSTAGIMHGYAFVQQKISTGNIVFYAWLVITAPIIFWWLKKMWSKKIDFHMEDYNN
jgi:hypothetical protein